MPLTEVFQKCIVIQRQGMMLGNVQRDDPETHVMPSTAQFTTREYSHKGQGIRGASTEELCKEEENIHPLDSRLRIFRLAIQ